MQLENNQEQVDAMLNSGSPEELKKLIIWHSWFIAENKNNEKIFSKANMIQCKTAFERYISLMP